MRRTLVAIIASTVTAAVGIVTAVVLWTLRHMSVGSVGQDRDRYDVYFDLTRHAEPASLESISGG
jgi:hypothetical protein